LVQTKYENCTFSHCLLGSATQYLEFGVAQGETTRYWCNLLRNPRSRLHGFDSFQGWPEDWILGRFRGHFDTPGLPLLIDDPRVQLFAGWFQDTLSRYEPPPHDVLVVNLDADLYSSTSFVLNHLEKIIVPGSYLYFDALQHREHELKAFDEFVRWTGMKVSCFGATHPFIEVVFRRMNSRFGFDAPERSDYPQYRALTPYLHVRPVA
jgi:O-methyltransferase